VDFADSEARPSKTVDGKPARELSLLTGQNCG
jgi:hypothetical protein